MTAALKHTVPLSCPNYTRLRVCLVLSPELTFFFPLVPRFSHAQALSDMVVILIWKVETPTGHVGCLIGSDTWRTSPLYGF